MRTLRKKNDSLCSLTYLRSINNQLDVIIDHAICFYRLAHNPTKGLRKMGKKEARETWFWTGDEYLAFAKQLEDKPVTHCTFEIP